MTQTGPLGGSVGLGPSLISVIASFHFKWQCDKIVWTMSRLIGV